MIKFKRTAKAEVRVTELPTLSFALGRMSFRTRGTLGEYLAYCARLARLLVSLQQQLPGCHLEVATTWLGPTITIKAASVSLERKWTSFGLERSQNSWPDLL